MRYLLRIMMNKGIRSRKKNNYKLVRPFNILEEFHHQEEADFKKQFLDKDKTAETVVSAQH